MPVQDLHEKEFDEGTLLKLDIFQEYFEAWLPTFLYSKTPLSINIFDLYCGPGSDCKGRLGSPLRVLQSLEKFSDQVALSSSRIFVHFSDAAEDKILKLKSLMNKTPRKVAATINIETATFEEAFQSSLKIMCKPSSANYVFIDPNGVHDNEALKKICKIPRTDFLLFTPAQFLMRFCEQPEFKCKLPDFRKYKPNSVKEVHRSVKAYLDSIIQERHPGYHLVPFAIRKTRGRNVHALIFGTGHLLGLKKFLTTSWKKTKNGEANFELEGDLPTTSGQGLLSEELAIPNKVKHFESILRRELLTREYSNNFQLCEAVLQRGYLPTKHARKTLDSLIKEGIIQKERIPLSYPDKTCKKVKIEYIDND